MHIRHDPERQRFVAENGVRKGVLEYETRDDGSLDLRHTFVLETYRGEGIATALARCALGHAIATERPVVASCPFVANVMAGDPAYSHLRGAPAHMTDEQKQTRNLRYAVEPSW